MVRRVGEKKDERKEILVDRTGLESQEDRLRREGRQLGVRELSGG